MNRRKKTDARVLLHRLWTKAVHTEGYVKADWTELQAWIERYDKRRRERRTEERPGFSEAAPQ